MYLVMYLSKNNKTNKQKQNKTKTGEKRKEERWKKERCGVGLKLGTIG